MARTRVEPVRISPAGVPPMSDIPCDPVNGNAIPNSHGLHIVFMHTDAESPHTVTIITTAKVGGFEVEDLTITLEPWESGGVKHARICGGFNQNVFGTTVNFIADSDQVTFTAYTK